VLAHADFIRIVLADEIDLALGRDFVLHAQGPVAGVY
jgi:hypothetical protein